jgi:hypothetical protein
MHRSNIYLEVRRPDGAILSYFLECPTTKSEEVDYVEATIDELTYLSALEDHIFPAGTVATLSDLQAHRKRLEEAKATKMAQAPKTPDKPSQKLSQSATEGGNTPTQTNKEDSKERFIAALKQHRSRK